MNDLPFYYKIARNWPFRGQIRIFKALDKLGLLRHAAPLPFFDQSVLCPLYWRFMWGHENLNSYDRNRLDHLVDIIKSHLSSPTVVDCGADIGLVSLNIAKFVQTKKIIAIEPNAETARLLQENLKSCNVPHEVINAAVSDFRGKGELVQPAYDASHHAAYLRPFESGSVAVLPIDALNIPPGQDIVLKLDVEGEETAALMGAEKTIADARSVCFFVEIHNKVLTRIGKTPEDVFGAIKRQARWYVSDDMTELSLDIPFHRQVEERVEWDVIGITTDA